MLSLVPLLALLVYGSYGSPDTPDQPLAARLAKAGPQQDFAVVFARMEAHLAANPTDTKGWSLIAPIYLRQGRYDDAANAFASALRYGKPDPEQFAGLGEARTLSAEGVVTATAREAFAEAVKLDPKNPRARYYLALAQEQDGDVQGHRILHRLHVQAHSADRVEPALVRDPFASQQAFDQHQVFIEALALGGGIHAIAVEFVLQVAGPDAQRQPAL